MINCQMILNRISPYVDGELDGRDMLRVRRHIEVCNRCACELERYRQLKAMVAALPEKCPESGFEQRLISTVFASNESARSPGQPQVLSTRGALALGAAAVAAFAIFQFGAISDVEEPTASAPAIEILVHDQEFEMARGLFPANTIPAGLDKVPKSR